MTTRALVLSDTHVPDFARGLPTKLEGDLARADLILHAGDVTSASLLDELARYAPVHVAMGNNDDASVASWGALEEVRLEVEAVRVAMIHDSGPRAGREGRLRRRFPDADLVVFGHSHMPVIGFVEGQHLLNPGSPTWKRREPEPTYAWLTVRGKRLWKRMVRLH